MTRRRRAHVARGAAALAAVWLAVAAPRIAAAAGCVAIRYVATLDRAAQALRSTPEDLEQARSLLGGLVAGDTSLHAELDPALGDINASPPDTAGALQRLDTLRTALALPPGSTCHTDPGPASSKLDGVYRSHVFANLDQSPQPGIFDRVGQGIAWLLSHLRGALGVPGSIALGAVVLASALALAAWRLRGILGSAPARLAEEAAETGIDPAAEWRLALAAAQRGDHREAIRRAFRSALLEAADRGRLSAGEAWTTRELLASITGDPGLLAALAPAAATFDYAWYSGRPSDAADWERARSRCDALRALARKPPVAGVA